ncbi:ABC transporter permease [Mycoplasma sp. NEAQ87857]|uniref:ABC transporter permease n=1 Tax=Mycoplasma sp. NEAQ87857 TaxID=2683967 RepID=UPI001316BF14|nr:ABC transporter permease [Mycoplasma sp. NEAQ87857]QGZ97630.1 ABC transporter permease [Mycoplasma sp. NEAQ87857]
MKTTKIKTSPKQTLENVRSFLMFDNKKDSRKKIYASLWAIIFGLLIASVIYVIIGRTGASAQKTGLFTFVNYLIKGALQSTLRKDLYLLIIFFGFSGLAVAVSFKSGLFNIGVPAQMTLPAILFFTIIISNNINPDKLSINYLIGMFFVFILLGLLVGAISGILKAYFNVHEVISTIFLNWIITYLASWLFNKSNFIFFTPNQQDLTNRYFSDILGLRKIIISNQITYQFIYVGFALLILLALGLWFLYNKTTLGYKIKMVGINPSNAEYVGINRKLTTILVMSFSGALAGLSGFYYIILKEGKLSGDPAPLSIGFESIAISLIALNSPIGVCFSSMLYSFIYNGAVSFQLKNGSESLKPEFFLLLTGLIIFMAALSVMFYKFKPLRTLAKYSYLFTNKDYWLNFKTYHISKIKYLWKERFVVYKHFFTHLKLKAKFAKEQKEYENQIAQLIKNKSQMSNDEVIEMYSQIAKLKVEFRNKQVEFGLNEYVDLRNRYKNTVYSHKSQYKLIKEHLYNQFVQNKIYAKYQNWLNKGVN